MSHSSFVKCVIWDLDYTLWDGILLEENKVQLHSGIQMVLETLDNRGILHSIASHNDEKSAIKKLKDLGIMEFFLYPQINYDPKPDQIIRISKALGFKVDNLAFIDDDIFQREQVKAILPDIKIFSNDEYQTISTLPPFNPDNITIDAVNRRRFYQSRIQREESEINFTGSRLRFLESCNLTLYIKRANTDDIDRVSELILRTNQFNANTYRYEKQQVQEWLQKNEYDLIIGELSDCFGKYGTVGVSLIQKTSKPWTINVLLVSCRALGRGVGEGLLTFALNLTHKAGEKSLNALYRKTSYNQAMNFLFISHGFIAKNTIGDETKVFNHDLRNIPAYPSWLKIEISSNLIS
jgi:FkbH-like protein